jgi:hypothetical protein
MELPNVEGQDQRIEGIGRGVFLPSLLNSSFSNPSMILASTNWTSGGGSGKTKLVKRKGRHSIEKNEDDEDLQMLNIVPLKKKEELQQK